MRPIKLEITGLQSFSEKQTINFDELTSMGLFGIFGETGSGKSTILDAIIFSIFDQIPRTMGSNGKNIRSSLNSDSNLLEVYFKFCLGKDIFEITRTYKKKYNRKGEEKFEQSNPIMIKNNDVIADTVKNVETKVKEYFGIGVSDFTRSVVLPQGKFSDFLKLKGAEKMTMLENIFDLDKYGTKMSDKISSRLSVLKEKIAELENQIVGKGDFSPELMLDLEDSLKSKKIEYDFVTREKNSVQSHFLEMSDTKKLSEKLDFYNSELDRLEKSKLEIDLYSEKLKKHELSSIFKVTLHELEILKNDISVFKNEVIYLEKSFISANYNLEKFKTEEIEKELKLNNSASFLNSLKIDYDELEALRRCEGYLNTLGLKEKLLAENILAFENENRDYNLLKEKVDSKKNLLLIKKNDLENILCAQKDSTYSLEMEISAFKLSQTLITGKECPVCGSKDHPNKAKNEADSEELILKSRDLTAEIAVLESTISIIHENILQKEKSQQLCKDKIELYNSEILLERENISLLNLKNTSLEYVVQRKLYLDNLDKDYRKNIAMKTSFESELRAVKDKILKSSNKVAEITLNLAHKNEGIKNYESSLYIKNEKLEKDSLEAGFNSREEIMNSILNDFTIKSMKNALEKYSDDFVKYNHLKDEVLTSLDGKVFEEEEFEILNLKHEDLRLKHEVLVKEIAEISSYLERIQKLADEARGLLLQINDLITKQDDLLLLQKKLKGRKFVNFLARKRLDYIAYEASKKLQKITRGRYLLAVNKDCDFNIIDGFNSNHIRDCATLSGGETFIVSLVLALALSSQLQLKGNIELEFFFLDEGFGTLDGALLDRVIQILEEIRLKDKMKIGIISHVEDLKIRIPRRLDVFPAIPGEKGSVIKLI